MKKILSIITLLALTFTISQAQQIRFNSELDRFCKSTLKSFSVIPKDRKTTLDGIAKQLATKKYVLFTCKTNSRRTLLLQVWAQTSFYYFGLNNKLAVSVGDTITNVYREVASVLTESGFYCNNLDNAAPNGYLVSISKESPVNMLSSKKDIGTIDTAKGIVINICFEEEQSTIAATKGHVNLPYQSPAKFEKTQQEKQKYTELNNQIATEMLFLAKRTKEYIIMNDNASE